MDENRILDRLRRGDPAALEKLMDRYLPYVSAVVWNILRGTLRGRTAAASPIRWTPRCFRR